MTAPTTSPTTTAAAPPSTGHTPPPRRGVLDFVEWLGNKLPEPALLFAILCSIVIGLSALGSGLGWKVQPVRLGLVHEPSLAADGSPMLNPDGTPALTQVFRPDGRPQTRLNPVGQPISPRNLLTSDGIYWMLSSMLRNFFSLPAMSLVFVAMLGIGVAEKFGLFSTLMRALALATPKRFLTPMVVLIGANAAIASDAGYIVLPPLAAALYAAIGRHPVAGLAAAFSGVAGGFGGGFFPTGADGALTGSAQDAAQILEPAYSVNMLHNLFFKSGSAIVIMLVGWLVTDRIVEPRLNRIAPLSAAQADPESPHPVESRVLQQMALTAAEGRALVAALGVGAALVGLFLCLILIPGWPLHGMGAQSHFNGRLLTYHEVTIAPESTPELSHVPAGTSASDILSQHNLTIIETATPGRLVEPPGERWSQVLVPVMLFVFLIPGIVFGILTGALKTQKDFVDGFYHGVRSIVPVLVLAFFLGQFVAYLGYTNLDRMAAYAGGSLLVQADLPLPLLIVLFVILVICGDFMISGMIAKFAILAPIFIPMFMMVGASPELTTAAYRIGDSVVNVITPLNAYLLIILAVLQKYRKDAGLGALIALMLPYSVCYAIAWTSFLLVWYYAGLPLGPGSPLSYAPTH